MAPMKEDSLTVVILESQWADVYACDIDSAGAIDIRKVARWDPSSHLEDNTGKRVFEEIVRQVRSCWEKTGRSTSGVALTLPGTLDGVENLLSSSRLGIRQPVPAAQILTEALRVPCRAFHDVECLAVGESMHTDSTGRAEATGTLVYVFADEGIGSKTLIDGRTYVGAGVAGTLGRLTVQPDGSYFRALTARGPLEVFSSRPWVSENLVAMYLSEQQKRDEEQDELEKKLEDTIFRRALRVAAEKDWRGLDYSHMANGIHNDDPVAIAVLDVAARYLGFAINSVITILNPHRIVLGGCMMTELPRFAQRVIAYARRYSWPLAWNNTNVTVSSLGREAQVYGAVERWLKLGKE